MAHTLNRYASLFLALLCGCGTVAAQEEARTEVRIGFRAGSATLETSFGQNAARLSEIIQTLETARRDTTVEIVGLTFTGSASPDGSSTLNRRLAAERMGALEQYARKRVSLPDSTTTVAGHRPLYMALKTNLLYDALAVPNIGFELYLGRGWSDAADWMYGWWDKDSSHRYWRIYGGSVDVRKWIGRQAAQKPLTGHHIGVYAQMFTYDFETGGKGYMGGKPGGTLWQRMNYAAGAEYGYSMPVARRINIDFGIGVGYWGGTCYEYTPLDGHYVWTATRKRHWLGPTKAEITLVWLLGRGNCNNKTKGGTK